MTINGIDVPDEVINGCEQYMRERPVFLEEELAEYLHTTHYIRYSYSFTRSLIRKYFNDGKIEHNGKRREWRWKATSQ